MAELKLLVARTIEIRAFHVTKRGEKDEGRSSLRPSGCTKLSVGVLK